MTVGNLLLLDAVVPSTLSKVLQGSVELTSERLRWYPCRSWLHSEPDLLHLNVSGILQVGACSFCLCSETSGHKPVMNWHPVVTVNSAKRQDPPVLSWYQVSAGTRLAVGSDVGAHVQAWQRLRLELF